MDCGSGPVQAICRMPTVLEVEEYNDKWVEDAIVNYTMSEVDALKRQNRQMILRNIEIFNEKIDHFHFISQTEHLETKQHLRSLEEKIQDVKSKRRNQEVVAKKKTLPRNQEDDEVDPFERVDFTFSYTAAFLAVFVYLAKSLFSPIVMLGTLLLVFVNDVLPQLGFFVPPETLCLLLIVLYSAKKALGLVWKLIYNKWTARRNTKSPSGQSPLVTRCVLGIFSFPFKLLSVFLRALWFCIRHSIRSLVSLPRKIRFGRVRSSKSAVEAQTSDWSDDDAIEFAFSLESPEPITSGFLQPFAKDIQASVQQDDPFDSLSSESEPLEDKIHIVFYILGIFSFPFGLLSFLLRLLWLCIEESIHSLVLRKIRVHSVLSQILRTVLRKIGVLLVYVTIWALFTLLGFVIGFYTNQMCFDQSDIQFIF